MSRLLVDPKDDRHLALRSSFGLMLSRDAGVSWDWHCKAGLGYHDRAEPSVAILNGGAVLLGLSTGISTGDRTSCDFRPAVGIDGNVVDVVAITETRGAALAVSVSFSDSSSRVFKSTNGGRSFRALGAAVPRFTALSLALPAALPQRVYMTGLRWGQTVDGGFALSDDGGKTFTITPIPNSDSGTQPFIAALNPQRPDTLYVRFTGLPGRLQVSDDAGRTFREALATRGPLQALAFAANENRIIASSLESGTYSADANLLRFTQVACGGVPCLAATGTALLACGERSRNGFVVGRSVDGGQSFAALLDTPCIVPAHCAPGTSVGAACAKDWPRVSEQLVPDGVPCDRAAKSKPSSRACFSNAGGVSAGEVALKPEQKPSSIGATSPGPDAGTLAQPRSKTRGLGCSCLLAHRDGVESELRLKLWALLLAACVLRSRRACLGA